MNCSASISDGVLTLEDGTQIDLLSTAKKEMEFSDKALAWDNMYQEIQPDDDEDTQENYDLREKMDAQLKEVEDG